MHIPNRISFLITLLLITQISYIQSSQNIVRCITEKTLQNLIPATSGIIAAALGGFNDEAEENNSQYNKTLNKKFFLYSMLKESEQFPLDHNGLFLYYTFAAIANPQATIIEFSADVIKKALVIAKESIPKVKKQEDDAKNHAFKKISHSIQRGAEKLAAGSINTLYFAIQSPRSVFVRLSMPVLEKCIKKDNDDIKYIIPFTFIHIMGLAIQTTWIGFLLYKIPAIKRELEKLPHYNMFKYAYKNYLQ